MAYQFILNHFVDGYDPTIEDSYRKQVVIDQQSCMLEVLDTAGQKEYMALRNDWIQRSEGFILVYSVVSRHSFAAIKELHHQVQKVKELARTEVHSCPDPLLSRAMKKPYQPAPIILVGNKSDCVAEREVSTQEGSALAKQLDCEFMEASAKSPISTQRAFFKVVRQLRKQQAYTLQPHHPQDYNPSTESSQLASKNNHHENNQKEERRHRKHRRYSWFPKSRWFGSTQRFKSSQIRVPSPLSPSEESQTQAPLPSKQSQIQAPSAPEVSRTRGASPQPPSEGLQTLGPSLLVQSHIRVSSPPEKASMSSSSVNGNELLPFKGIPDGTAEIPGTKGSSAEYLEPETGTASQSGLVGKEADIPQNFGLINSKAYNARLVLVDKMTKALFCTEELEPILTTALNDPDIGAKHLQDKTMRMIRCFGRGLKNEAREKGLRDIAQALEMQSVLFHTARSLIQHLQTSSLESYGEGKRAHRGAHTKTDPYWSSINILNEDVEILSTTERPDIRGLLFSSKAYHTFKADVLGFTQEAYGERLLSTVGGNLIGSNGENLTSDAIYHMAGEISWVPTRLFEFSHDTGSSLSDSFKALVEQSMGETWNWWPLAPRVHLLAPGYFRLKWKSVRIQFLSQTDISRTDL